MTARLSVTQTTHHIHIVLDFPSSSVTPSSSSTSTSNNTVSMSKPTSISSNAPGAAEKQASAAQPVKQGRWGWPLRSSVDVSKLSSSPSGAGSGSSARKSSIPENSVVKGVSPSQPGTVEPKVPAEISSPKPTRANSANLAHVLDKEAEQGAGEAKPPRTSISSERPLQPQLPLSQTDSLDFDDSVNAPNSIDTQNPPNTEPVPPLIDPKTPKRTWPPVQTRTKSQDSTKKEYAPLSSSRKSSASTLSTRKSSRNLPIWPPVSSFPADARDAESNGALSPLSSRNSIGPEDNKPIHGIRGRASADQAPLPSSSVNSDRIGVEADDEPGEHKSNTAQIPEAIQTTHEQAEQKPLSHIPGSFPTRSDSTFRAPVTEEAESVSGPLSSTSSSPVSEISKPVRAGGQAPEEKTPVLARETSETPKAHLRTASYETEKNPWDDASILQNEVARQIPAEPGLANGSSQDPGFSKRETELAHSETQIPGPAGKGPDLNVKESEPKASEPRKNDKRVTFANLDQDSSSSGSTTPTEQAPNGIKEDSPSTISKVGNEDTTSSGTRDPSTHNQFLPLGHETRHDDYSAGSSAAPQSDVSLEDLSSVQGIKSQEVSVASSPDDVLLRREEAPLATPTNPETSLSESTAHFHETDRKEKLPDLDSTRTLGEDKGSLEKAGSRSNSAAGEGKVLDVIIGVQAEVRQKGNPSLSNEIPKLETVRTVIEIPHSPSTDKKLSIPKIHVQNPTDGTEPEVVPRKASVSKENSLNAPRSLQSATRGAPGRRSTLPGTPPAFVDSKAAEDQVTKEEPKVPPLKKRTLCLRKVRNVAARRIILEITLGRELAKETKPKLRRLASGEQIGSERNV